MPTPKPLKRTKERASRIALDYYKRGDRLLRWKRMLALGALLAGGAWIASGFLWHDNTRYSPGQLAWAHATWDKDCAACHVDFSPIRNDAFLARMADTSTSINQQCKRCHPGPDHHPGEVLASDTCASCHTEHRGRSAELTRTDDRTCTDCHADLKEHSRTPPRFANVSRFDKEHHPQFKAIGADPGTLKFSHRRHLAAGLTFGPTDRADALVLDKLPADSRAQYQAFAGEKGLLTLDCSACHQAAIRESGASTRGEAGSGAAVARSTGAYMPPVTYERHCQACHPLHYAPPSGTEPEPYAQDVVPHRLTPKQMARFLGRAYADKILKQDESLLDQIVSPRRELPHKPAAQLELTRRLQLDQKVASASAHLRVVCSKCHALHDEQPQAGQLPEIRLVNVPEVWFKHARFDHAAHRFKECRECHVGESLSKSAPQWIRDLDEPDAMVDATWTDNREILIPGIDKCIECHGPSTTEAGHARGGARFQCVECHWYHPEQDGHSPAPKSGTARRLWPAGHTAQAQSDISRLLLSGEPRRE